MRQIICTVGVSVLNSTGRPPELAGLLRELPGDPEKYAALIAAHLRSLGPDHKSAGVEINSLYSILSGSPADERLAVALLHSDTDGGERAAGIIGGFLRGYRPNAAVEVVRIEGLDAANLSDFSRRGLRNLVRRLAGRIKGRAADTIINATGGYRAQIAFALVIGQAMHVPVYYLHDGSDRAIQMPPLPVTFDYRVWQRYADGFWLLAREDLVAAGEISELAADQKMTAFIETVEMGNGEKQCALTPAGQVFFEAFASDNERVTEPLLPPAAPPDAQKVIVPEPGIGVVRPQRVNTVLQKILARPYVSRISQYYYNPDLNKASRCWVSADCATPDMAAIRLSDGSATGEFMIYTTAETPEQRVAVVSDINGLF